MLSAIGLDTARLATSSVHHARLELLPLLHPVALTLPLCAPVVALVDLLNRSIDAAITRVVQDVQPLSVE
jgi:hypothetical protein